MSICAAATASSLGKINWCNVWRSVFNLTQRAQVLFSYIRKVVPEEKSKLLSIEVIVWNKSFSDFRMFFSIILFEYDEGTKACLCALIIQFGNGWFSG